MTKNDKKLIDNMSFEEALNELEKLVDRIDSGQESLDSSIDLFERGVELKKFCEKKLKNAKLKIEKVIQDDGEIKIQDITNTYE